MDYIIADFSQSLSMLLQEFFPMEFPSGCGAASPSQGPWDPDPLRRDVLASKWQSQNLNPYLWASKILTDAIFPFQGSPLNISQESSFRLAQQSQVFKAAPDMLQSHDSSSPWRWWKSSPWFMLLIWFPHLTSSSVSPKAQTMWLPGGKYSGFNGDLKKECR